MSRRFVKRGEAAAVGDVLSAALPPSPYPREPPKTSEHSYFDIEITSSMSAPCRVRLASSRSLIEHSSVDDPIVPGLTGVIDDGSTLNADSHGLTREERADERARRVERQRRDVVVGRAPDAVLEQILLDVGRIERRHRARRRSLLELLPNGADRLVAGEVADDRDDRVALLEVAQRLVSILIREIGVVRAGPSVCIISSA